MAINNNNNSSSSSGSARRSSVTVGFPDDLLADASLAQYLGNTGLGNVSSLIQYDFLPSSELDLSTAAYDFEHALNMLPSDLIAPLSHSMDNSTSMARLSLDSLLPIDRRRSLDEETGKEIAKERRRTQNRFAQRAYRQRREQAIKDQEKEIESLKEQLEKEKKLNQALVRVIEVLKLRLSQVQRQPSKHPAELNENSVDTTLDEYSKKPA